MAVDARAIITFGFYPENPLQFESGRLTSFGFWEGITEAGPLAGDTVGGTQLTILVIGQMRV